MSTPTRRPSSAGAGTAVAGERGIGQRAVGHRGRQRADGVEARGQRIDALRRDGPATRLEPHDATARGGQPDGAAGVGSEPQRDHAGRQRRRVAAARPAGHAIGRGRVDGVAIERVLTAHAPRELVGVGLADHDRAFGLQREHRRRALLRDVVGVDRGGVGRAHARRVDQVLDEHRHAGQGAADPGARPGQGLLLADADDRVELGLRGDARQRIGHHLLGAELAGVDAGRDVDRVHRCRCAIASISSRAPGTARRLTSTSVLAGRLEPKNSWRTGLMSGRSSMSSR